MTSRSEPLPRLACTILAGFGLPTLVFAAGCPGDDVSATSMTGGETTGATATTMTTGGPPTTNDTVNPTSDGESASTGPGDTSSSSTTDTTSTSSGTGAPPMTESTSDSDGSTSAADSTSTGRSTSDGSTTDGGQQSCPNGELMVPDVVLDSTLGEDSEFLSSCGGNGAPDVSYTLTAPVDGMYVFDTVGSSIDTILAVFDGNCGGEELACNNDDPDDGPQSRVSVPLAAGQTVTVVVDGFALLGGDIQLNAAVFEGTCPNGALGNTVPQVSSGSTLMADNTLFGSCGGGQASDEAFTFTAPQAGIYTIDTESSDFDTVLYVRDGCAGTELACDDNGGAAMTSRVNVTLEQDQQIVVVVDGFGLEEGDFDLNIDLDACPDFDLGSTVPQSVMGSTVAEVNSSSGTCVGSGAPDVAYTFAAPFDGAFVFDTAGSDFDTGLYAFEGETCQGTQLACNDDAIGTQSEILLDLVQDQVVTIVVDGFSANSGDYTLNVQEYDSCGDDIVNGADVCDMTALGQTRCEDLGFTGGSLDCSGDCATFDLSECSDNVIAVCSSPGAAIDSAFPTTTDTITVPNMGTITDVDVFVDVTHTFDGDLEISLLADDLGLSNELTFDNCGGSNDVWAFFNDEGNAAVGTSCVEPVGIEGNTIPDTALSAYDGSEASGEWTLSITDDAGSDTGTLNTWCLYFTL